jgi:hypothetical protein
MVKEKRKGRLDKSAGTAHAEFIGFSSFANSGSASEASSSTSSWSPIYTGSDVNLQILFPRISQKRNATTKAKALQQLQSFLSSSSDTDADRILRRQQVEAIQHFAWLYYQKLHFDASPVVRAAALEVWVRAYDRIPKAVAQLVTSVQPELLGMMYTASQADRGLQSHHAASIQQLIERQPDWPWEHGLVELYALRMLSFGRSSTMYEALFAKNNTKVDALLSRVELSESHKDAAEEQFERIVGTCIDALRVWVSSALQQTAELDTSVWWKTLGSGLPALRLKTLHLLMASCQNKVSIPSQVANMLIQELSSERHVTNVPTAINALVAYISFLRQSPDEKVDVSLFVKPVTKILKKSCYGAPAIDWAPALLPLSFLLGTVKAEYANTILTAAWDGRSLVLGGDRDRFTLAKALAESASHWLLLPRPSLTDNPEEQSTLLVPQELVSLWAEAFHFSLSIRLDPSKASPLAVAHSVLLDQLCSDLVRFYQAIDGNDSAFKCVIDQDMFWTEYFTMNECDLETMSVFLERLTSFKGKDKMMPHVRKLFHDTLIPYQKSSGASPSEKAYLFCSSALRCYEAQSLFYEKDEQLKKFIMNDLLRWMILHTSRISEVVKSSWTVERDFEFLYHTLRGLPERQELWNVIVRELVSAECDLKYLTIGLDFLLSTFKADTAWVACPFLSQFALSQGKFVSQLDAFADHEESEDNDAGALAQEEYDSYLHFFLTCVGIPFRTSIGNEEWFDEYFDEAYVYQPTLIGRDDIKEWIDSTTSQSHSKISPLLETLIRMIVIGNKTPGHVVPFALSEDDQMCILLQTWKISGKDCGRFLEHQLFQDSSLQDRFLTSASTHLSKELSDVLESNRKPGGSLSQWVSHACRLFSLTQVAEQSNANLAAQVRRSILLQDGENSDPFVLWKAKKSLMCSCAIAFFNELPSSSQRISALLGDARDLCDESNMDTILLLLMHTTETFQLPSLSTSLHRDGMSKQLFSLLVGNGGLDRKFLRAAADRLILELNTKLTGDSEANIEEALKMFSLLSMIIMCLFGSLFDSSQLSPDDIVEGEEVQYISNPEQPENTVPAKVEKVHFDSQTGYYYSITFVGQGESTERQTVLERLRKDKKSIVRQRSVPMLSEVASQTERLHTRNFIVSKLIKPFLIPSVSITSLLPLLAESLTLLGAYVGLGEEKGIGSPKYEVHQILTLCDSNLQKALDCDGYDSATRLLWFASLGLGYGLYCDPARWSHQVLQLSFIHSLKAIDNKYNSKWPSGILEFDCAVLSWLTGIMFHINEESAAIGGDPEMPKTALTLIFKLATSVLSVAMDAKYTSAMSIGSIAIEESAKIISRNAEAAINALPIATDSFSMLIRCFCSESKGMAYWNKSPSSSLEAVINSSLNRDTLLSSFAAACNANFKELLAVLFDREKCYLAFRLLQIALDMRAESQTSEHAAFSESLSSRLKKWSVGLSSDEIEELEEDILIVSEWIPEKLLTTMEHWTSEDLDGLNEEQTTGQLLSWLICLRTLEKAASTSFRNRPAFVSYLSKCGVFNHILNLALLNEETVNSGKRNCPSPVLLFEDLLFNDGHFPLSGIASVVLFRSIEILPALAKRWWEEDCPKVYISPVQSFVEKYVGPRILERELERIRNAPGVFGNMNVTASSVSREIMAEYVQDDFTLKVLINLPAAFPFRSAEVDCSKTLGVPQNRSKRWSLQIMMMLNSQGGTLIDALILWKDNVDKEFEGIEACPVCYSVLHVKTHKLPGLQCKTCSNRFHSDCLMEWFRSSGKSQCVLCQQPWEGTRVL